MIPANVLGINTQQIIVIMNAFYARTITIWQISHCRILANLAVLTDTFMIHTYVHLVVVSIHVKLVSLLERPTVNHVRQDHICYTQEKERITYVILAQITHTQMMKVNLAYGVLILIVGLVLGIKMSALNA
jgi:hypothetical protein